MGRRVKYMQRLICPQCRVLVMTVSVPSVNQRDEANRAMAKHMAEEHLFNRLEAMLATSAFMSEYTSIGDLWQATRIQCAGCSRFLAQDTNIYYSDNKRTMQCCSLTCFALAQSRSENRQLG